MNTKKFSKDFAEWEFLRSEKAQELGIKNNYAKLQHKDNLIILVLKFLQPLRDKLGKPIHINSGYRCEALNKAVGGAVGSYHTLGMAVDIRVDGMTPKELFEFILNCVKNCSLPLPKELILEPTWVHISFVDGAKRCTYWEKGKERKILLEKKLLSGKENILEAYKASNKKTIEKSFNKLIEMPIEKMSKKDKADLITLEKLIVELKEKKNGKFVSKIES